MRGLLYSLLVILLFSDVVSAQQRYSVAGKVLSNNEPLIGASVVLKGIADTTHITGVVTDTLGSFRLNTSPGMYILEISYIGYNTLRSNVNVKGNVNLPSVSLSAESEQLKELVVTANTVTFNSNGYVAEISKNPLYKKNTLNNILLATPGTSITSQGVINAYGKSVSKVYINNRELKLRGDALYDYLQTLEGGNVKHIEVILSSGVEGDASSAGRPILKIVTEKNESGGLLGIGALGGYRMNGHIAGGSSNMQWRINDHWGVYYNLSANGSQGTTGNESDLLFYDSGNHNRNLSENRSKTKYFNGIAGITYDLDKNNLFSIEGNFRFSNSNNNGWNETSKFKLSQSDITSKGNTLSDVKSRLWSLSFFYLHRFSTKSDLTLKAEGMSNTKDDSNNAYYDYYLTGETQQQTRSNYSDNRAYTVSADYTHTIPSIKGKFSCGAKAQWLSNDNDMRYVSMRNMVTDKFGTYEDKYKYLEDVYAFYSKFSCSIQKVSLTAGLRAEYSILYPKSEITPERNEKHNYFDLFPEFSLGYSINRQKGHNIMLAYNRIIIRPSITMLNPLVRRVNDYSYTMGNPSLKPYFSNQLSFMITLFNSYYFRMLYEHSSDNVLSFSERDGEDIYTTYYNLGTASSLLLILGLPIIKTKNINLSLSGSYSYRNNSYGEDKTSSNYWSAGFSGLFNLPADISISANISYIPPSRSLYSKTYYRPMADVIISKRAFNNRLNMSILFGDIFDYIACSRTEYYYDTFYQEIKGTKHNFGFAFNIRYNLRWGKKSAVQKAGTSGISGRLDVND